MADEPQRPGDQLQQACDRVTRELVAQLEAGFAQQRAEQQAMHREFMDALDQALVKLRQRSE